MEHSEELTNICSPIMSAKTDDLWSLAALAELSPEELASGDELANDDEKIVLLDFLKHYRSELFRVIHQTCDLSKEDEKQVIAEIWSKKVIPREQFENQIQLALTFLRKGIATKLRKSIVSQLIRAGAHLSDADINPKMLQFVSCWNDGCRINLKETIKGLIIAKHLVFNVVASNSDVLFIGMGEHDYKPIIEAATKSKMHYVCTKWIRGILRDFSTVRTRWASLESKEEVPNSRRITHNQQDRIRSRDLELIACFQGLRNMEKLPGVLVVVNPMTAIDALKEARELEIPVIGILDTDSDPDLVDVAIPASGTHSNSISILLSEISKTISMVSCPWSELSRIIADDCFIAVEDTAIRTHDQYGCDYESFLDSIMSELCDHPKQNQKWRTENF